MNRAALLHGLSAGVVIVALGWAAGTSSAQPERRRIQCTKARSSVYGAISDRLRMSGTSLAVVPNAAAEIGRAHV